MKKTKLSVLLMAVFLGGLGSMNASAFVPPKNVRLGCAPLPYLIDCSISRMANPEYSSHCWMVDAAGHSLHMRTDYRFNFTNGVVGVHVNNDLLISARLVELSTGRSAVCAELLRAWPITGCPFP